MGEDAIVVEIYHIFLLLAPIFGGGLTGLMVVWKYLIAPALAHRHETDMALHILKNDVAALNNRLAHFEGRLAIKE